MKRKLRGVKKRLLQQILPRPVFAKLWAVYSRIRGRQARKAFEQAPEMPVWLDWESLESLQQKCPPPRWITSYDPQSIEKRGEERAQEILNLVGAEAEEFNTFLELGCGDGMVSYALQRQGKIATAIDIQADRLEERAIFGGVKFVQMDATHLEFDDGSFDFVFSYNTFEHFHNPEKVLQEAIRVVRTGGYIYLDFDPLYMAPWGLHAYRVISVPYCQILFPRELLQAFATANGLGTINFDVINNWSLEAYRELWNSYAHRLKRVRYHEIYDVSATDLIEEYPSCFKSKTKYFDNLIVSRIKVLFRRSVEAIPIKKEGVNK